MISDSERCHEDRKVTEWWRRLLSWSNQGWSPQRNDIRAGTWLTKQSQTHVNIRTKNSTKNIQVEKKNQ